MQDENQNQNTNQGGMANINNIRLDKSISSLEYSFSILQNQKLKRSLLCRQ